MGIFYLIILFFVIIIKDYFYYMMNHYIQLFNAIRNADVLEVKNVLQNNQLDINKPLDIDIVQHDKSLMDLLCCTPLYYSVKRYLSNNTEQEKQIVEILLENKADVQTAVNDFQNGGLFTSPYNYVILNNNENLKTLFSNYLQDYKTQSLHQKARPKNTETINITNNNKIFKKRNKEQK